MDEVCNAFQVHYHSG
jgi:hypothetical protein